MSTPRRPAQAGQSTASTIAGVAAMITAVGGTVGVLYQTGVIGHRATSPASSPTPAASASPSPGGTGSPSASPSAGPGESPSPSPGATSTPAPTPSPSPTPTPDPSHGVVIH